MSECCKDIVITDGDTGATGATGAIGVVGDKGVVGDPGAAGADAPELKGLSAIKAPATAPALNILQVVADDVGVSGTTAINFPAVIYDDWISWVPATGIWTCPTTQRYDLNAVINLKQNWNVNATHQYVVLGIINSATNAIVCAKTMHVDAISEVVNISCVLQGVTITAGTTLCVKILNRTISDYIATAGDIIYFAIRKCK